MQRLLLLTRSLIPRATRSATKTRSITTMSGVEREILPEHHKPRHYDLRLRNLDLDNGSFSGKVAIDFEATASVDTVSLDAVELDVQEARVEDAKAAISYTADDGRVHLKFPRALGTGRFSLSIDYTGKLNDLMAGFYRSSYPDEKSGERRYLASTQFEAVDARRAFPCYDEPACKATFDVTITADEKFTILGNMSVKSESVEDGLKTVSFKTTPIMSTYLLAWVVGELEYIEAFTEKTENLDRIPLRVYTIPGKSHRGRFALDLAARSLEIYSRTFGIPYSAAIDKLDQVAIPSFAAGAMENWGLVTYRDIALLIDEKQVSASQLENAAETISHEISHQWFGNSTTFTWWEALWLNEAFATWMSKWNLNAEGFYPDWHIWDKFVADDLQSALRLDALRSSHPIHVPVQKAHEVDEIFDHISYAKGGSFLRMLSKYLGEDIFLAGVRNYLKRHQYRNATAEDLWTALAQASGKEVRAIAELWTRRVGFPVLNVTDGGRTVEQHRYLSSGDVKPEEDETIWWIPLAASTFQDGKATTDDSLVLTERKATLSKAYDKFNTSHTGVYRVNYEPEHLVRLGKTPGLSVADRAGLIADAGALSQSGHGSTAAFLSLLTNFDREDDFVVWSVIASQVGSIGAAWMFESEQTLSQLKDFRRKLYAPRSHELGHDISPSKSEFTRNQLKALLFAGASDADDAQSLEACKSLFSGFQNNRTSLSPDLRGAVFRAVARHGSDDDFAHLVVTASNESLTPDIRLAALRSLGDSTDPKRIATTLAQFDNKAIGDQDLMYVFAALRSNRPGVEALEDFLLNRFADLERRVPQSVGSLKGECIRACIAGLTDESRLPRIADFFRTKDTKGFSRIIEQAYDAVRSKSRWVRRDGAEVADFLTKQ